MARSTRASAAKAKKATTTTAKKPAAAKKAKSPVKKKSSAGGGDGKLVSIEACKQVRHGCVFLLDTLLHCTVQ